MDFLVAVGLFNRQVRFFLSTVLRVAFLYRVYTHVVPFREIGGFRGVVTSVSALPSFFFF